MPVLSSNLFAINKRIRAAEKKYHRAENSVRLLAVSKKQSIEKIKAVIAAGQTYFGENYLQEALSKIKALQDSSLEWHFIGGIQVNKTRAIAENFAWAHGVARTKIAERLNQQRPNHLPPLNVCIQINISDEANKQGVCVSELSELASAITQLEHLKLRGLMAIPAYVDDFSAQRKIYHAVAEAQNTLVEQGFDLDTLSMGMSHDFEAAIAEGSTIVRIGTALFGERE